MPVQYKWYGMFFNVNTYYSKFKGQAADYNVDADVFSFNIYAQQTFKLSKTTTAELTGFYTAPSIWQGAFKTKSLGSLDAGIQQTLFKGKATVKATYSDLLNTFHWSATNNTTGQTILANGGWESRQFKINLNYRFGNNKVKQARQHKSSIEEEKSTYTRRWWDSGSATKIVLGIVKCQSTLRKQGAFFMTKNFQFSIFNEQCLIIALNQ
jgi:hypothetical protein